MSSQEREPEIETDSVEEFTEVLQPTATPSKINLDPEKTEQGLAKLVLAVIELLRQLLEKQAIRRMESGSLTDEEVERLGITLMRLEEKIKELQEHFELDDLNIDLGPLGNLLD